MRGGTLAWQLYAKNGEAQGPQGAGGEVPAWSLISAYARPDGGFVILH